MPILTGWVIKYNWVMSNLAGWVIKYNWVMPILAIWVINYNWVMSNLAGWVINYNWVMPILAMWIIEDKSSVHIFDIEQWIFEIEDGAFLEDGLSHEVVARRYRNVSWRKYFCCSRKHHFNICRMHVCVCIRMKTSRSKSVALSHSLRSFTYAVFLWAPEHLCYK